MIGTNLVASYPVSFPDSKILYPSGSNELISSSLKHEMELEDKENPNLTKVNSKSLLGSSIFEYL